MRIVHINVLIFVLLFMISSCGSMINDASSDGDNTVAPLARESNAPLYRVSGIITDKWNSGVFSVQISGNGQNIICRCAEDGTFGFGNVSQGKYILTPAADNVSFYPEKSEITVAEEDCTNNRFKVVRKYWDILFSTDYSRSIVSIAPCDNGIIGAGYLENSNGNRDIYVVYIDCNGDRMWEKTYGDMYSDEAVIVRKKNDNYYILCNSVGISSSMSGCNIRLIKMDKNGNLLRDSVYGGYSIDKAADLLVLEDGSVIVAGSSRSFSLNGDWDCIIFRIDPDGSIVLNDGKPWCYGGESDDFAAGIVSLPDGYALVGNTMDDISGYPVVFVSLLNRDFSLREQKTFQSDYNETALSVSPGTGGIICIAGYAQDNVSLKQNFLAITCDSVGGLKYRKIFPESGNAKFSAVYPLFDGGFIFSGALSKKTGRRDFDYAFIKTDKNLIPYERVVSGDADDEIAAGAIENPDGGFYSVISVKKGAVEEFRLRKTDISLSVK
jgi:WD40 repeat protein